MPYATHKIAQSHKRQLWHTISQCQNSLNAIILGLWFWDVYGNVPKTTVFRTISREQKFLSLCHLNLWIMESYRSYKLTYGLRVLCYLFNTNGYKELMTSQWPFFVPVCPVMPIWLLEQQHLPGLDEITCLELVEVDAGRHILGSPCILFRNIESVIIFV